MAIKKKLGKNRLDKYYHLAKEQGYRARSAFKLVQLNKKYNFLEKARVLVDLCAAPGGWLQVASKYMPVSKFIIGIDLAPIKPIPNVITLKCDITTEKCRSDLKKELKTWKVDVFLNDGAPNVGSSWLKDAYSQSELVLSALKLATEFLVSGGTFVTKVFRSKDYNSLIWVFQQLFGSVDATKPPSSRNVSAEIFVVCRDFKAPKKIDPRFFDPKYVFQDMKMATKVLNIFQPEKKVGNREGYEDGATLLYKKMAAYDFLTCLDATTVLGTHSEIVFDDEKSKMIAELKETDEEIRACCKDLKVLGKKEFKVLIRWRLSLRKKLELEEKVEEPALEEPEEKDEDEEMEEQLEKLDQEAKKRQKKLKQKNLLKKAKTKLKMQMTGDADYQTEEGLFSIQSLVKKAQVDEVLKGEDFEENEEEEVKEEHKENEDIEMDSDEEVERLEEELDADYERYKQKMAEKDPKFLVKETRKQYFGDEFHGFSDNNEEEVEDEENEKNPLLVEFNEDEEEEKNKAMMFFTNPMFQSLEQEEVEDKKEVVNSKKRKKEGEHKVIKSVKFASSDDDEEEDDEEGKKAILTAEGMTMALGLANGKKGKMIDDSFNRYAFHDPEGLPKWFLDDENLHNKPSLPVTKEAIAQLKEKMKVLDQKPIKKVMEAKARRKMKASRKVERMRKKANNIVEDEDLTDRQKLETVQKMMKSAVKKTERKVKLVVAKGSSKGSQGRPKGVKGRYKMVDSRMKKEVRAIKRAKKAKK
jgi:AdoMet-dependent rRNA methyltransferase SPB1